MVKKARCLPCDFFFKKFGLAVQVVKSVKPMKKKKIYRPSKPQELKKASCNKLMSIVEQHFFSDTVRGFDEVARFQGNPKGLDMLGKRFESPERSYCH